MGCVLRFLNESTTDFISFLFQIGPRGFEIGLVIGPAFAPITNRHDFFEIF